MHAYLMEQLVHAYPKAEDVDLLRVLLRVEHLGRHVHVRPGLPAHDRFRLSTWMDGWVGGWMGQPQVGVLRAWVENA